MKLYNGLIIVLVILLSYTHNSNADVMDNFIKSINPDLSREQAIRFAMEKTFEIQSEDNLKRKLRLYVDSVNDITIVARSIGVTEQQLDKITHALGYILAKDIMSDGVYSIEEISKYAKQIRPEGLMLNEVIEGMKLEIELKKWRQRNELIRRLMDAGFAPKDAQRAISIEEGRK
ncbi:MAG: hypothetical protein ACE5KZ_03425 [Candidatus Scalinduaceae bacterium]